MKNLAIVIIFFTSAGCSSTQSTNYNYGFCYQPLYWPSECIEPDPPSKKEYQAWRKERYRQWKSRQGQND